MHWGRQCAAPPIALAGRWAGRCAERRVAWPWRRRHCNLFLSVSYCVGKMLKSVNVCLECPVFNASGAAMCRPQSLVGTLGRAARRKARRLALAEAPILFSVSCCVGKTLKCVHERCARQGTGKNGNGKETGKERVLSFPVPPFLGTRFFPVSGQNREKRVKNEAERPKNGRKDVERRRTAVPRRSKL